MLPPAELIRAKRNGRALDAAQVEAFVRGLAAPEGSAARWADAQVGAMAMAILLRGMSRDETVVLTRAMAHSGTVLDWRDAAAGQGRPVLDKHSTGGVGDKVSLLLAPIVAACGGLVPMVSGRGLGHTGGTLDKLEALPGYTVNPPRAQLLATLRGAGCAIVGAGADLAPADARLYAVRDVTATVESVPLIVASILSKKLAAGLQGLVMDVKLGNGAFLPGADEARALARQLVEVAGGAGLPTAALLTDMNQPLGRSAGNALEVAECAEALRAAAGDSAAEPGEARLMALTRALSGRLLRLGGLAADASQAEAAVDRALASGAAAEAFARMVAGLGGPSDVLRDARLPEAPVCVDVPAPRDGVLAAVDTRALGLAIVALGGGRRRPGDAVDPRVGFSRLRPLGSVLRAGEPLLRVHAADAAGAAAAAQAVRHALTLAAPDAGPAWAAAQALRDAPVIVETWEPP